MKFVVVVSQLNHDILCILQIHSVHKYAYPFSKFSSWIVPQNAVPHFQRTCFDVRSEERIYKWWKSAYLGIDARKGEYRTVTIYWMLFYKYNRMAVDRIKNSKYYPPLFFLILAFPPSLGKDVSASTMGLLRKAASVPVEPQAQTAPSACLPSRYQGCRCKCVDNTCRNWLFKLLLPD